MHDLYWGIPILIFLVAALYSSVGHGGASGYLAVLTLLAFPASETRMTALILNIIVASMAFIAFARAGYFSPKKLWPFVLTSVPAAFIGGLLQVSGRAYLVLLALALFAAAARLCVSFGHRDGELRPLKLPLALVAGAGIGLLSGMVGIGGGIFLSPLLLLLRWTDAKSASATAAGFIVVNSLAGLGGNALHGTFHLHSFMPFLLAAVLGGMCGSYWGANRFSNLTVRRSLALVLVLAAGKMVITSFGA